MVASGLQFWSRSRSKNTTLLVAREFEGSSWLYEGVKGNSWLHKGGSYQNSGWHDYLGVDIAVALCMDTVIAGPEHVDFLLIHGPLVSGGVGAR